MIFIDFETFSDLDVRKVGAYRYAQDPSTEILCMAYQVDNGPVQLWRPGESLPPCLYSTLEIHAWNAFFEICIWSMVAEKRYCFPRMKPWQWRDTMALAAYFGLPLDLQRASDIVAPDQSKDRRGTYLISVLCKPVKPTKAKPWTRLTPENSPELFQELYEYCRKDVRAERAVHDFLPRQQLPDDEQDIWYQNLLASLRGTQIDLKLIAALIELRDEHIVQQVARFKQLTGGLEPTQVAQVQACIAQTFDVVLPDMTKGTIAEVLRIPDLWPRLREILEIRQSVSKTSVKKLDAMIKVVSLASRAHGMLVYYGAHTGRNAGRLIQLQNLPQGSFEVFDVYCDLIREGLDLDALQMLFGDPMAAISTFIRSCLTASPGKSLYVADYSAIEARVLAWLAGQLDLVEKFFFGVDSYIDAAVDIYEEPAEVITKKQRALGKVQILGCGFGMGKERFAETCAAWGVEATRELTDRAVDLYRENNPAIVKFWSDIEESAKEAINHPNKAVTVGKIVMASNGRFLFVKLPSGRTITYAMPKVVRKKKNFPFTEVVELLDQVTGEIITIKRKVDKWILMDVVTYMGIDSMTKQWQRLDTWGGSLVENIVQGVARDVMAHAQMRTSEAGFEFLFSVHDELVSERAEEGMLEKYIEVMVETPAWAAGLPIAAEGYTGQRFRK